MHEELQIRTDAGFNLPESYRIEDREAKFCLALAIFGFSCTTAVVLGFWMAGLA
ncbi:hypothetical protein [Brucella anthropi]|uniref:hypothetical protein n=1 Tax=Brucella anthropi TaxID=529 RepID=UPI0018657AF2|nr:hypothetical protein [Brucella anthropi]